jgi:hypothetical protein
MSSEQVYPSIEMVPDDERELNVPDRPTHWTALRTTAIPPKASTEGSHFATTVSGSYLQSSPIS